MIVATLSIRMDATSPGAPRVDRTSGDMEAIRVEDINLIPARDSPGLSRKASRTTCGPRERTAFELLVNAAPTTGVTK